MSAVTAKKGYAPIVWWDGKPSRLSDLLEIDAECAVADRLRADPRCAWEPREWEQFGSARQNHVLMSVDRDGSIAGYLAYSRTEVSLVAVRQATRPSRRREGVARDLLRPLKRRTFLRGQNGKGRSLLASVGERSLSLQLFYRREGLRWIETLSSPGECGWYLMEWVDDGERR